MPQSVIPTEAEESVCR